MTTPGQDKSKTALIFVCPTSFPVIRETRELVLSEIDVEVVELPSATQARDKAASLDGAVIIFAAGNAQDIKDAVFLGGALKSQIQDGTMRLLLLSSITHPDLPAFLKKHGIHEIIPHDSKPKGLKLKISRIFSMVLRNLNSPGQAEGSEAPKLDPAFFAGDHKIVETPPLAIEDDCWIIRKRDIKYARNFWFITVIGPSARIGRWVAANSTGTAWRWTPSEQKDLFVTHGSWLFLGKQPEFRNCFWSFCGPTPRLSYFHKHQEIVRRLDCEGSSSLMVAENSKFAIRKIPLIKASFEFEIHLQNEDNKNDTFYEFAKNIPSGEGMLGPQSVDTEFPWGLRPFAGGEFGEKTSTAPERLALYQKSLPKLQPKGKLFQKIGQTHSKVSYIRESAETQSPAVVWTNGQAFRRDSKVLRYSERSGMIALMYPEGYDREMFKKALEKVQAKGIFVNTNLHRSAVFFANEISAVSFDEQSFKIRTPMVIYEVQRRQHLRYQFAENEKFDVRIEMEPNMQSEGLSCKAHDIAAGGLHLEAAESLLRRVKVGDSIPKISLKIYNRWIHCAGQVRWKDQKRLGLQFVHIRPEDQEGISLFVMEQSYEYLRTYLAE